MNHRDTLPPLTQFYAAYLISNLGNFAARLTLAVIVYSLTGNPVSLAASFIVTKLPTLLFGNAIAVLVRHLPAKAVLIVSDALALLLFITLAFSYRAIGTTGTILVFGCGYVLTGCFDAAKADVVATLCPDRARLNRAAATLAEILYVALACGPLLAGILIERGGIQSALLFNAATYAGSLVLIAPLRMASRPAPWREALRRATRWRSAFGFTENLATIRRTPLLSQCSLFYLARSVTYGLFNALVPVVALHQLRMQGAGLGTFSFIACIGAVVGARIYKSWVQLRVPAEGAGQLWYLGLASCGEAVALAWCIGATQPAVWYAAGFCFSVPMLLIEARIDFLYLHLAPPQTKGAMQACQQFIKALGFTGGTGIAILVTAHMATWVLPWLMLPGILLPLLAFAGTPRPESNTNSASNR
ncbi:MAG: MFS transporter [Deltaproteobacteria bacterium]|nr:MFS transporter [Deltaproteobacteria bacterium]